jgi:hypothetical protein
VASSEGVEMATRQTGTEAEGEEMNSKSDLTLVRAAEPDAGPLATITSDDMCRMLADSMVAVVNGEPGALKRAKELNKWARKVNREMNARLRELTKVARLAGVKIPRM